MKSNMTISAIVLFFLLVGCDRNSAPEKNIPHAMNQPQKLFWEIQKSPNTGRCYEVLTRTMISGYQGYGFMGMSEIPCDEK